MENSHSKIISNLIYIILASGYVLCLSNLALLAFGQDSCLLGWREGCPVHFRLFSSIPNLYPVDTNSSLHPKHDNQNWVLTLPNVSWAKVPLFEKHRLQGGLFEASLRTLSLMNLFSCKCMQICQWWILGHHMRKSRYKFIWTDQSSIQWNFSWLNVKYYIYIRVIIV